MEQSKQAGQETPKLEDATHMAIMPVSSLGFSQARIPGMQVQRRNNSSSNTASQASVVPHGKTLMPVNIKQIVDSWAVRQNNIMVINNCTVSSVKVIGQVRGKLVDEYKGSFRIQDCSGEIKASIWFTCGRQELDRIPDGAYAAAVGRVKTDGCYPELQCYDCRPIVNFNDITHHHLSVIATHIDLVQKPSKTVYERVADMWAEELSITRSKGGIVSSASFSPPAAETCRIHLSPKKEILSQQIQTLALDIDKAELSGMARNPSADPIIKFIQEESKRSGPEGIHVILLCDKLKIDKDTVREHLKALEEDGEVYTTIDEDHYAAT